MSLKYLKIHHNVEADKIILNGIDTNLFKPRDYIVDSKRKPVIIDCANDYNKNGIRFLSTLIILRDNGFYKFYNKIDIIFSSISFSAIPF